LQGLPLGPQGLDRPRLHLPTSDDRLFPRSQAAGLGTPSREALASLRRRPARLCGAVPPTGLSRFHVRRQLSLVRADSARPSQTAWFSRLADFTDSAGCRSGGRMNVRLRDTSARWSERTTLRRGRAGRRWDTAGAWERGVCYSIFYLYLLTIYCALQMITM
jgi:hypothetical protein